MDLIEAAKQGNIVAVWDAIEKGADVNTRDNLGYTALTHASISGYMEIASLLKKAGAL